MSTVTVPRSDVSVDEVSAVLRRTLGPRYSVTPSIMAAGFGKARPGDANTILVAANRLERANVRVATDSTSTEIRVSPGATYFGLIRLVHRVGLVRKVQQALVHAPELAGSD
jgi:FAD/FMN-containing dehydrogenase